MVRAAKRHSGRRQQLNNEVTSCGLRVSRVGLGNGMLAALRRRPTDSTPGMSLAAALPVLQPRRVLETACDASNPAAPYSTRRVPSASPFSCRPRRRLPIPRRRIGIACWMKASGSPCATPSLGRTHPRSFAGRWRARSTTSRQPLPIWAPSTRGAEIGGRRRRARPAGRPPLPGGPVPRSPRRDRGDPGPPPGQNRCPECPEAAGPNAAGVSLKAQGALARRLTIGGCELLNVPFMIFPDDQPSFSLLPPGERGVLGLPALLPLGTLRWERDGTFSAAFPGAPRNLHEANICCESNRPLARGEFRGAPVMSNWIPEPARSSSIPAQPGAFPT